MAPSLQSFELRTQGAGRRATLCMTPTWLPWHPCEALHYDPSPASQYPAQSPLQQSSKLLCPHLLVPIPLESRGWSACPWRCSAFLQRMGMTSPFTCSDLEHVGTGREGTGSAHRQTKPWRRLSSHGHSPSFPCHASPYPSYAGPHKLPALPPPQPEGPPLRGCLPGPPYGGGQDLALLVSQAWYTIGAP